MPTYRDPNYTPAIKNQQVKQIGIQYESSPDAAYGSHIYNTSAICNSSASHTYGNVMSVIEKYILDIFPEDLFKTVASSVSLTSRQVTHAPAQLVKKEMPAMVLIPRVVFGQEDDRFLAHTQINDRFTNTNPLYGYGSLIELAKDTKKKIYVHGHYNRALMYVDVIMTFNTYSEQLNYMSYIHNMISIGHNQFIRAPLELYIPEEFCKLISNLSNIPITDENGSISNFSTYMNSIWYYPITYKLKGGSNTNEFFMYYIADIDTTFHAPEAGQGIKDGQVRRAFDISFTVRCEFNTIGYFTLNSPNLKRPVVLKNTDSQTIVPIFSDVINLDDFDLPIGWQVLSWPIFKLNHGENSISLDPILNQSLKSMIDYHLKCGIPMERFINIQFRENGKILNNESYYIDWNTHKLIVLHPDYHRTYRLIITISADYINNTLKRLYNLE